MASWVALLLLPAWLGAAQAQNFTLHASYIFANTGARTPLLNTTSAPSLTNLGAQQMYNLGALFRSRYISNGDVDPTAPASPLQGLSSWRLSNDAIFIQAVNQEYASASALAFMQAFYPPYNPNGTSAVGILDPSALTSQNVYVEAPLNGYQYPSVDTVSHFDPYSVFLSGSTNCDNFQASAGEYFNTLDYNVTSLNTADLFQRLGSLALNGVLAEEQWAYANAYLVWDYINYQYTHNSTLFGILTQPEYANDVARLHALASKKQYSIYGDQSASGAFLNDRIRTIAGQTLASRIVGLLSKSIASNSSELKLVLNVGEYGPMLALFSLLSLNETNSGFSYIPPFGSAFTIELFSYTNSSAPYPPQSDLWVRFLYANGSFTDANPSPALQPYPILARGSSEMQMRWPDFATQMLGIGIENIGDWCVLCAARSVFCPAFLEDPSYTGGPTLSFRGRRAAVSGPVAGLIGGAITFAIGALLAGLLALCFGVGVHRDASKARHRLPWRARGSRELRGFKGAAKMASDADLHLPRNGAPAGGSEAETAAEAVARAHERHGSWEMDQKAAKRETVMSFGGETVVGAEGGERRSLDFAMPVHARENV